MKSAILLLIIAVTICSCTRPSYVNSVPRSSMLEKKGDFNASVGIGPETIWFGGNRSSAQQIVQSEIHYSPFQNWGVGISNSFQMKLTGGTGFIRHFKSFGGSIIHYKRISDKSSLEYSAGIGIHELAGEDRDFDEQFFPVGSKRFHEKIRVSGEYTDFYLQFNWNHYFEETKRASFGLRAKRINYSNYFYDSNESDNVYDGALRVTAIEPFIENNYFIGKFGLNTRVSYSFLPGTDYFDEHIHPIFNRLAFYFGASYRF